MSSFFATAYIEDTRSVQYALTMVSVSVQQLYSSGKVFSIEKQFKKSSVSHLLNLNIC